MSKLELEIDKIRVLCNKHKVAHLFVFGTVLTGRCQSGSDVDWLEDKALKNPFLRQSLDTIKQLIHGLRDKDLAL